MDGRNIWVSPFVNPILYAAGSGKGKKGPLFIGEKMVLYGDSLKGNRTLVQIGDAVIEPADQEISDREIGFALDSPLLKAGKQNVRVIHKLWMGRPPVLKESPDWRNGPVSNSVGIKLCPKIMGDIGIDKKKKGNGGLIAAEATARIEPKAGKDQKINLLLNELSSAAPSSHVFPAHARNEDSDEVKFSITGAKAAAYLARIEVDGAATVLEMQDGVYSRPVVSFEVTEVKGKAQKRKGK